MYNLNTILEKARVIVAETSSYIGKEMLLVSYDDVEEKELNSLVSYVDKNAEKQLVENLGKLLPEAGFVTEEDTIDEKGKAWTWIIDPLDGTTNFLHQIPHFCVSVALMHNDELVLGIVHDVIRGEQFYAIKGQGAFMNGKSISVSKYNSIDKVLVATGFPYRNDYDVEASFAILKEFLIKTRGIRRLGSAALDLCYVAIGRIGGYYEGMLNAWDIAAGALIVQEAGGKVSNFSGKDTFLWEGEILASAAQFHQPFLSIIQGKEPERVD